MIERPWQPPQPARGTTCPFCPPDQGGKIDRLENNGEVIEWHPNKECYEMISLNQLNFSPMLYHELLVPRDDSPWLHGAEPNKVAKILATIFKIQRERVLEFPGVTNAQFEAHFGLCAGQNVKHGHAHIIGSDWPQAQTSCPWCEWQSADYILFETERVVAFLDGVRAGQTVVLLKNHESGEGHEQEIALVFCEVRDLFSQKFNTPEYMIGSSVSKNNGHFWMEYIPILNHFGYSEFLAMRGLGAYCQPCSGQEMLNFLKTGNR